MSAKEYKIVLAGDFGSGRTTFITRFNSAKQGKSKVAALKCEIYPLKLYTSAGTVLLNCYDSTLHAKGGIPDQAFYRTADACILFFDVNSEATYKSLEKHHEAFTRANPARGSDPAPVVIVGNKIDAPAKDREVKPEDIGSATGFPRKKVLKYVEASGKGNWNVKEAVVALLEGLLGDGIQLTDNVELAKADVEVDEARAEAAEKAYEAAK